MWLLIPGQRLSKNLKLIPITLIIVLQSLAAAAEPNIQSTQETLSIADDVDSGSLLSKKVQQQGEHIEKRLTTLFAATNFYIDISVRYMDGVIFLDGIARDEKSRTQAADLVKNIEGVAAVINRLEVAEASPFDLAPMAGEIRLIWQDVLRHLPRICLAFIIIVVVVVIARQLSNFIKQAVLKRFNPLIKSVITRIVSILLIVAGLYFALIIAGLGQLSNTILGGTGLAGLVAGIALKDLLENYLASILISIRNPFKLGDIVEINEHMGIVERVTTRGTVLLNQDGNHVQIPNAIVYKSIIRNLTANPKRRDFFEVGIGYDCRITEAQEIALQAIKSHPGVLHDPETLILADRMGAAAIILKIYFWYDCSKHVGIKVKSALIRMVKQQFEQHRISMPDEAREIVFPQGVPVQMIGDSAEQADTMVIRPLKDTEKNSAVELYSNNAEGESGSEEELLLRQARTSRAPEEGDSILGSGDAA